MRQLWSRPRHWPTAPFLLVAVLAAAQAPSTSEIPPPTIRVSTHLVVVDAVVTDKQGKVVNGLRPEDFVVEENGKPQKISTFVTPAERTANPPATLPPGIYSNRPQYRSPGGPIAILLLDALNTPFSDQAYARTQMLKFVREQYKPGQRMAIFALTGSLIRLQDFTSDPQVLYSVLEHYSGRPPELEAAAHPTTGAASGSPTATTTAAVLDASTPAATVASADIALRPAAASSAQQAVHDFENAQASFVEERRIQITLNALNTLARMVGGLPGRKSLIWVTSGFPFTLIPEERNITQAELEEEIPSFNTRRVGEHAAGGYAATSRGSHSDEIRETAARLSNAQVAIYPIDAKGLSISSSQDTQDTMREIARETGGRVYVNQNEIREGVERAVEDTSATYTLGYYPQNKKWDGKYRSIKVSVKREGTQVFSRRGYYAIDLTQVKGYNPNQEVAAAVGDISPATLVAFSARLTPASANTVKGKLGVDFLVDSTTVSTEDAANGGKKINVAFYATAVSADGRVIGSRSMKVDQAFDTASYQQILQRGLLLHMDLDPPPPNSQLDLAVQDNRTGLVGTIKADAP